MTGSSLEGCVSGEERQAAGGSMPAIYGAIRGVMGDVKNVIKGSYLRMPGTSYPYRSIDDLVHHVGAAARDHGVMLESVIRSCDYERDVVEDLGVDRSGKEYKSRKVWTTCRLHIAYRFTSLVDGSSVVFEAMGEGRDNSDKSTAKAMSMALKYALGQALLIPSGDADPDSERPEIEVPAKQTAQPVETRSADELAQAAWDSAQKAGSTAKFSEIRDYAGRLGILDRLIDGVALRDLLVKRAAVLEGDASNASGVSTDAGVEVPDEGA